MVYRFKMFRVIGVLGFLAACGQTAAECAATGALLGAGAARITGENVGTGALIGGAAGLGARAATGTNGCY